MRWARYAKNIDPLDPVETGGHSCLIDRPDYHAQHHDPDKTVKPAAAQRQPRTVKPQPDTVRVKDSRGGNRQKTVGRLKTAAEFASELNQKKEQQS